ncbi:MAG: 3-phosphoshikimate 1-carboxyvinyltransferase [Candidatus Cloacimonadota bacterium]|nr:3-phosphoshikimate 1-carboxyvinyltransferase [Candidatus Cloacimonadota bacterium]
MKKFVQPSTANFELIAPPSKSVLQRMIIIASLINKKKSIISNINYCNDVNSSLNLAEQLGATISKSENKITIIGSQKLKSTKWNCGESGLCMRVACALSGLYKEDITILGEGSLLLRETDWLAESLSQIGIDVINHNNRGNTIFTLKNMLNFDLIEIDGTQSSQFISGLLIASAFSSQKQSFITKNVNSKKYIDLTTNILKKFNINIQKSENTFSISENISPSSINTFVEGDWSNAAFFLVAGAINGKAIVRGLQPNSIQPDKAIIEVLRDVGATVIIENNQILVKKGDLKSFQYDATQSPDLFPPLVALAVNCVGTSRIAGLRRLIQKESNRAKTLVEEFSKIGCNLTIEKDTMIIEGTYYEGGSCTSHNDHRIAMCLAIAGLNSKKGIEIKQAETVQKSFSAFWNFF